MATTKDVLSLLRPHQYLKNLFIFAPVLFAARFTEAQLLLTSLAAFACFSLTASGVYVFNDLRDREADREHPKKRNRPIASGAVVDAAAGTAVAAGALPVQLVSETARIRVKTTATSIRDFVSVAISSSPSSS
jgi:4-hydroxybenzoate polyprenyltransferase